MRESSKTERSMSLDSFLRLLKKKLWLIALMGLIFGFGAFAVTSCFITPQYEAGAKMIVNTKTDESSAITNDQITTSQKLVSTYSVIVKSRSVLNPVISKLNLDMSYEQLQSCVAASSVDNTQIMQISVRNPDRGLAEAILSEILSVAPEIIIESVEAGSVKIIENTYSSPLPVSPNKSLYSALALIIGCIFAVVLVTVKYLSDDTYKSAEEISEDTGIPVIGTIPKIR